MPPIPDDRMTDAQRAAAAEVVAGRRGALVGPFVPALRSPEFMRRLQRLGEYLRYEPALPPRLREMVILLTARRWTQQFEWHTHAGKALAEGLPTRIVDAIARGTRPEGMDGDEALVFDFCQELVQTGGVGDELYGRAVARLGEQGVIDLVGTIGYYSTLAMIMNVAQTPLPEGVEPPLGSLSLRP